MSRPYQFQFVSSGLGIATYKFSNGESEGRVEYRFEAAPFEASHFNGDRDRYAREVEACLNLLHLRPSIDPIPQDLVDAFNAFRQREHDQYLAWLESKPELLATIPADHPSRVRVLEPMIGARYDCEQTRWVRNDELVAALASAA